MVDNIVGEGSTAVWIVSSFGEDFDVLGTTYAAHRYIKLAVRKEILFQVDANSGQCLALGFVRSHRESSTDGELPTF